MNVRNARPGQVKAAAVGKVQQQQQQQQPTNPLLAELSIKDAASVRCVPVVKTPGHTRSVRSFLEGTEEATGMAADASIWNTWRWIPEAVFEVSATVPATVAAAGTKPDYFRDGVGYRKGPQLRRGPWTCSFGPCGSTNRGGKVCTGCFQGRTGTVTTYTCKGRACRTAGRRLQFGSVADLLVHLETSEGFAMAECELCHDMIWSQRTRDHAREDHPEQTAQQRRPRRARKPNKRAPAKAVVAKAAPAAVKAAAWPALGL